jgi:hypothetical protein
VHKDESAADRLKEQFTMFKVFQKELYNAIPNVTVTKSFTLKGVQTIHRSTPWPMDSLYAFKRKRFRNSRHTVTFKMPL